MEPSCIAPAPSAPVVLRGSCACGAVAYTSSMAPLAVTFCHCLECRKASGAPFLSFGLYHNAALRWQAAPESITFRSSDLAVRGTCRSCGTPLFMKYHCRPDGTSITMGSIDEDTVRASIPWLKEHIFLEEKVGWWQIDAEDQAARHDQFNEPFQARIREWRAFGCPQRSDIKSIASSKL